MTKKKSETKEEKKALVIKPEELAVVEQVESLLEMVVPEEKMSKINQALIFSMLNQPDNTWGWADTNSGRIPIMLKMQGVVIALKYKIFSTLGQVMILGNRVYVTVAGAGVLAKRQKLIREYSYRAPTKEERVAYQVGSTEFYVILRATLSDGSVVEESGRASALDTPSKLSRHIKNLEETAKTRAWGHIYKRVLDLDAPIHDESVISDVDYTETKKLIDSDNTESAAKTIVDSTKKEKTKLTVIEPIKNEEEKKTSYSELDKKAITEKAMKFKSRADEICKEHGLDFKKVILKYFNSEPTPEALESFSKTMGEINNKQTIDGQPIPSELLLKQKSESVEKTKEVEQKAEEVGANENEALDTSFDTDEFDDLDNFFDGEGTVK